MGLLRCTVACFHDGRLWSPGETREAKGGEPEEYFVPEGQAPLETKADVPEEPETFKEIQERDKAAAFFSGS